MTNSNRKIVSVLPTGFSLGGVTTWSLRICDLLRKKGHDALVLLHNQVTGEKTITQAVNIPHIICGGKSAHEAQFEDLFEYILPYRSVLPCTLIPNWSPASYAMAAWLSDIHSENLRIIAMIHADQDAYYAWAEYYEPVISVFVAVSKEIAENLESLIPHRHDDIRLMPYAVDCPESLNRCYSKDNEPLRLLYSGRIESFQKRCQDFLPLIGFLNAYGIDFQLRIVGEGSYLPKLQLDLDLLPSKAREWISLEPTVPPERMSELYQWADIFLLLSEFEGTSIAMQEAMAQGCVPVITKVSGTAALINPHGNGYVFNPGNLREAADLIWHLFRERKILFNLGRAAYETILTRTGYSQYVERFSTIHEEIWQRSHRKWPSGHPYLKWDSQRTDECSRQSTLLCAEEQLRLAEQSGYYKPGLYKATFRHALEIFKRHQFSNSADYFYIGVRLYQMNKIEESRPWFHKLLQWPDALPDHVAEAYFHLAEINRLEGDEKEWRDLLVRGVKALENWDLKQTEHLLKLGDRYFQLEEWNRSEESFKYALNSEDATIKQRARACAALGSIRRLQGKEDEWCQYALRSVEEFGAPLPDQPSDLYTIGLWLYRKGELKRSRHWLEKLVQSERWDVDLAAEGFFHLAEISRREDQEMQWTQLVRKGIEVLESLDPMPASAVVKLIERYLQLGELERGVYWAERALTHQGKAIPQQVHVMSALAKRCDGILTPDENIKWRRLMAGFLDTIGFNLDPDGWQLMEVSDEQEIWLKSRRLLLFILGNYMLEPNDQAEAMILLAAIDEKLGMDEWRKWFGKAADILAAHAGQSDIESYRIGSLYKRMGKVDSATEWFLKTLEIAKNDLLKAGVYYHLGEMALSQEERSAAKNYFRQCLQLNPKHDKARGLLGESIGNQGFNNS